MVPDFRIERRKKNPLVEMLLVAACSLICGGTSFYDFQEFGRDRLPWLR